MLVCINTVVWKTRFVCCKFAIKIDFYNGSWRSATVASINRLVRPNDTRRVNIKIMGETVAPFLLTVAASGGMIISCHEGLFLSAKIAKYLFGSSQSEEVFPASFYIHSLQHAGHFETWNCSNLGRFVCLWQLQTYFDPINKIIAFNSTVLTQWKWGLLHTTLHIIKIHIHYKRSSSNELTGARLT